MRLPDQRNVNVNMNSDLADKLAEQSDSRGYQKYKAIEGAN